MFLRILEFLSMFLISTFVWTQIFWPLWTGQSLFPLFGRRHKVEERLAKAKEREELEALFREARKSHSAKEASQ